MGSGQTGCSGTVTVHCEKSWVLGLSLALLEIPVLVFCLETGTVVHWMKC